MKKLSLLLLVLFWMWVSAITYANVIVEDIIFTDTPHKTITLYHGRNVVSTTAILHSIEFSNWWEWISFSKLNNWQRTTVPVTIDNIKPLEWFMVYNSNTGDINMTFNYKTDVSPTEAILQKNINFWWNLLWIVTINSPFDNIWDAAVMSVDFTNNWTINKLNKINSNYVWNPTSSNVNNPQLWEAYWIFINQENAVYWWINNWWIDIRNDATISTTNKKAVLLKGKNSLIAHFMVKPSWSSTIDFEQLALSWNIDWVTLMPDDIILKVDWICEDSSSTTSLVYDLYKEVNWEWVGVEVIMKNANKWVVTLEIASINGVNPNRTYTKRFENALVYVADQRDNAWSTTFTLWVEKADSSDDITRVCLHYKNGVSVQSKCTTNVSDWNDDLEWTNPDADGKQVMIDAITYEINWNWTCIWDGTDHDTWDGNTCIVITKNDYNDYFKVGGTYAKIFKID